ncbi:hypothetical protein [Streptomyces sp. URMC 123]|uniref:hypothetical protein n=1 Tax=Streptomyces sp. URMC 123 TaxID=3423403 RepID=UPI003F1DADBD
MQRSASASSGSGSLHRKFIPAAAAVLGAFVLTLGGAGQAAAAVTAKASPADVGWNAADPDVGWNAAGSDVGWNAGGSGSRG